MREMNASVRDYFDKLDPEARNRMTRIRNAVLEIVPEAEEAIKYRMPTIIWKGGNLLHYAAFANHIGVYPLPGVIEALKAELASYKQGKGSIQFQNDEPLPVDLIKRIAAARVEEKERESAEKAKRKAR